MSRALQHENCRVTNLYLGGNKIGDEGVEHLSRALQHENCRGCDFQLSSFKISTFTFQFQYLSLCKSKINPKYEFKKLQILYFLLVFNTMYQVPSRSRCVKIQLFILFQYQYYQYRVRIIIITNKINNYTYNIIYNTNTTYTRHLLIRETIKYSR